MKILLAFPAILILSACGIAQGQIAPYSRAYTGTAVVLPPTAPNVGSLTKSNTIVYDTSYPSGRLNPIGRCTDANFDSGSLNRSFAAGSGGSGSATQLFNANSTALRIENSGGSAYIALFDPVTMTCSNSIHGIGGGSFDWTDPTVWYNVGTNTGVRDTFDTTTGAFTVGPTIFDWSLVIPNTTNTAAWQSSHSYAAGVYVTLTYPAADWQASHLYSTVGDLIQPTVANGASCAFKLMVAGTSAASHAGTFWSNATCIAASNSVFTDGTAQWRCIGGPPIFVYELISASGTSGLTAPTLPAHPDLMTTLTDNGLTWQNMGPAVLSAWASFAGVSRDSTRFCTGGSTNEYGYNGTYTYEGGQDSGFWAACYSTTLNSYILLNTATGWQSQTTCTGGTGYNCSGGTITRTPIGQITQYISTCAYLLHNLKGSNGMDYIVMTKNVGLYPGGCGTAVDFWEPFATFDATTSVSRFVGMGTNHWAPGFSHFANVGQNAGILGGFTAGAYSEIANFASPTDSYSTSWQQPCGAIPLPPCGFGSQYDQHMSWAYNPHDADDTPICGTVYNLPTLSPIPVVPWQGEEVCVSTIPRWTDTAFPDSNQRQYRFTHVFNTGTNKMFSVQFGVSQLSTDGRFMAFSSNWMCGLGSTSGGTSALCGVQWTASTPYPVGTMLNPFSNNNGSGTNFGVWQVTTGGTSASSHPTWVTCSSANVGVTTTDANGLVYTCLGGSNDRGDVFIVDLGLQLQVTAPSRLVRVVQ